MKRWLALLLLLFVGVGAFLIFGSGEEPGLSTAQDEPHEEAHETPKPTEPNLSTKSGSKSDSKQVEEKAPNSANKVGDSATPDAKEKAEKVSPSEPLPKAKPDQLEPFKYPGGPTGFRGRMVAETDKDGVDISARRDQRIRGVIDLDWEGKALDASSVLGEIDLKKDIDYQLKAPEGQRILDFSVILESTSGMPKAIAYTSIKEDLSESFVTILKDSNGDKVIEDSEVILLESLGASQPGTVTLSGESGWGVVSTRHPYQILRIDDSDGDKIPDTLSATPFVPSTMEIPIGLGKKVAINRVFTQVYIESPTTILVGQKRGASSLSLTTGTWYRFADTNHDDRADSAEIEDFSSPNVGPSATIQGEIVDGDKAIWVASNAGLEVVVSDAADNVLGNVVVDANGLGLVRLVRALVAEEEIFLQASGGKKWPAREVKAKTPYLRGIGVSPEEFKRHAALTLTVFGHHFGANTKVIISDLKGLELFGRIESKVTKHEIRVSFTQAQIESIKAGVVFLVLRDGDSESSAGLLRVKD